MTLPVPLEAAKSVRAMLTRGGLPLPAGALISTSDLIPLIEFAEQFEPKPLPRMTVNVLEMRPPDPEPGDDWQDVASLEVPAMAGELNEIRLEDETLDAMRFDLIRLNGRTYAPEVIEVTGEPEDPLEPEEIGVCIGCARPLRLGEVVTPYDDEVGHADCEDPFSLKVSPELLADPDIPPPMVLIGRPARYVPLGAVEWAMKLPSSLHTAGNGQELTIADVERVIEGLEINAVEGYVDAVRLIRFLAEVVIAERDAEIEDLRASVIAFAAPFAAEYARDRGWPAGHMASHHFDILERAGARMTDFVRHVEPGREGLTGNRAATIILDDDEEAALSELELRGDQ